MKSPDPVDPVRLEVNDVSVYSPPHRQEIRVSVEFIYQPWEPSPAQNVLLEHARALDCIREALERGGVGNEW